MDQQVYEPIFRNAPLRLGSPLRAPSSAWPAWGFRFETQQEFERLVVLSEEAYSGEWAATQCSSHDEISRAAAAAGLGSANEHLNACVALVAAALISKAPRSCSRILDLGAGAGATTLAVWKNLDSKVRLRMSWTLIDPAKSSLEQAVARLTDSGMSSEQLSIHTMRDLDIMPSWSQQYDLVISTAAIHHHAYLEPVFRLIHQVLAPGGIFIGGDWHNSLSTHPAKILELLNTLQWKGKKADIASFIAKYPASRQAQPTRESPEQQKATAHIMEFWQAYARSRQAADVEFCVIEGHRPVSYYLKGFAAVGLHIPKTLPTTRHRNPHFLFPGSELLGIMAAQRLPKRTVARRCRVGAE
jgi:SAM-dependent methyltransferase